MYKVYTFAGLQKFLILLQFRIRFRKSFHWAVPEIAGYWEQILKDPDQITEKGQLIWKTPNKKVYRLTFSDHSAIHAGALKVSAGVKPLRYLFRCSKSTLEAANLKLLEKLGFPMVRLLALADQRHFFHLKRSFLLTEFADGFRDGRDFMPNGSCRENLKLKELFIQKNLQLLAKLHQYHCYHKAFRPYNLLWHYDGQTGDFQTRWLDVATCRFMLLPEKLFQRYIIKDLAEFFYRMGFDETEMQNWADCYLQFNPGCKLSRSRMLPGLKKGQNPH